MNLNQVTLPAIDMEASIAFYRQLGLRQIVDSPHYARFECPDGDATFSLHLSAPSPWPAPLAECVVYFECGDLDARVAQLVARGIVFTRLPADQSWLWREARLRDPAGNALCLYRAGTHRRHPPWRLPDDTA